MVFEIDDDDLDGLTGRVELDQLSMEAIELLAIPAGDGPPRLRATVTFGQVAGSEATGETSGTEDDDVELSR